MRPQSDQPMANKPADMQSDAVAQGRHVAGSPERKIVVRAYSPPYPPCLTASAPAKRIPERGHRYTDRGIAARSATWWARRKVLWEVAIAVPASRRTFFPGTNCTPGTCGMGEASLDCMTA